MRKVFPLALALCAFAAAGCEKKEPTPGERLDQMMKDANEAAEDAQEKAADAVEKASEEMRGK